MIWKVLFVWKMAQYIQVLVANCHISDGVVLMVEALEKMEVDEVL